MGVFMHHTAESEESRLNRRRFIQAVGALSVVGTAYAVPTKQPPDVPIIDSHIHLFDASRPQGAPYKGPKEFTSHISLPGPYSALAAPLGIVGAVAAEA